ncbi:murein hydrolase activator EnvC family protein [Jannaschia ovalis]|uniref:Peptidoglycan DD-metalloendopeptidase family protein n=1 Tax=Jannaschia ovalis TaxID=3038773 RepID=A0ABY8LAD0_9RHOB|nr:peptidoglycan DD-metalloendopeptidase family protein [Jannaschia sp. GRR-S6-38]WGH77220.1 peptidoglycan DD-metalloendopeptidase family protein [Jannaschia sp. GRR-S6-38]
MILRALLLWALLAGAAQAQSADTARRAAGQLAEAALALDAAQSAGDRVTALTGVVRAYETGLSALRDGLRQLAIRETALATDLAAREGEIARLVAALSTIERSPGPLLLLHPSGALGTARSAMMLGEITPALNREAEVLRRDLSELQQLRRLEETAAQSLRAGLTGVQAARAALSEAITDRAPLPERFAADAARVAGLRDRVDTLEAFADGLGALPAAVDAAPARPLPLPVAGTLLREYQEPDAAGIVRPGLVLATAAGALVTAPTAGTIRYAGPLLDYGNVIILEPEPRTLLVFAGLSEVYGRAGEIVAASAPLGLMGGSVPDAGDFLRDALSGGGVSRPETLYVEVREAGRPVDPATWFAKDE